MVYATDLTYGDLHQQPRLLKTWPSNLACIGERDVLFFDVLRAPDMCRCIASCQELAEAGCERRTGRLAHKDWRC